jgi:hypothetical protein
MLDAKYIQFTVACHWLVYPSQHRNDQCCRIHNFPSDSLDICKCLMGEFFSPTMQCKNHNIENGKHVKLTCLWRLAYFFNALCSFLLHESWKLLNIIQSYFLTGCIADAKVESLAVRHLVSDNFVSLPSKITILENILIDSISCVYMYLF